MRLLRVTRGELEWPVLHFATRMGPRSKWVFGASPAPHAVVKAIREALRDELFAFYGEGWRQHDERPATKFAFTSTEQALLDAYLEQSRVMT